MRPTKTETHSAAAERDCSQAQPKDSSLPPPATHVTAALARERTDVEHVVTSTRPRMPILPPLKGEAELYEMTVIPVQAASADELDRSDDDEEPIDPAEWYARREEAAREQLQQAERTIERLEAAASKPDSATVEMLTKLPNLTFAEAALLARVSTRTIRRAVTSGALKTVQGLRGRKGKRIRRSDLDGWLSSREQAASPTLPPRKRQSARRVGPPSDAIREAFRAARKKP